MSRRRPRTRKRVVASHRSISPERWNLLIIATTVALVPVAALPVLFDPFQLLRQLLLACSASLLIAGSLWHGWWALPRSRLLAIGAVAVLLVELAALALSQHPLSSVLGVYRYRLGAVTQVSLLVLFIGTALSVRTEEGSAPILRAAAVGLAVLAAYGTLQAWGIDPVNWRVRNPGEAALGTLGNQNDMAGYILVAASSLGATLGLTYRHRWLVLGALATLMVVVVISTHSRSGLGALGLFLAATVLLAAINRWPLRNLAYLLGTLTAALVIGSAATWASGDLEVTLGRVESTVALTDDKGDPFSSGSFFGARKSIWRGSWAVFQAHPVLGPGQDSLYWEFHRERPADLGAPFNAISPSGTDPLLASAHSAPLEVMASTGIAGMSLVVALVALTGWAYLRLLRRSPSDITPFLGAGLLAYSAMALLNPLPLACLALLVIFTGLIVGLHDGAAVPVRPAPSSRPKPALKAAAAVLVALVAIASLVAIVADNRAYNAVLAATNGDLATAAGDFGRAAALAPIESTYRRQQASYTYALAVSQQDEATLRDAHAIESDFLDDFGGLAVDHLLMALIQATLGDPEVYDSLEAAHDASPYGLNTAQEAEELRAAIAGD